jgi:hypothetical protein
MAKMTSRPWPAESHKIFSAFFDFFGRNLLKVVKVDDNTVKSLREKREWTVTLTKNLKVERGSPLMLCIWVVGAAAEIMQTKDSH